MKRSWISCALASAGLMSAGWAQAGAGIVNTSVYALSSAVTYSRAASGKIPALATYIGYVVTVGSDPSNTNTINNVVFTGTIAPTDPDEAIEFSSSDGASCQPVANPAGAPANARTISCSIGQLRAGQTYTPFAVFFQAPLKDAASPLPDGVPGSCGTTDCAGFAGTTYYGEGTGGVPQSTPDNSTVLWSADSVTLGTFNPTTVKSGVTRNGGTLYTGLGAVATATDPWTTTVGVPAGFTTATGAAWTTATINETEGLPTCAADLLDCNLTSLAIPGEFSRLTITLRRDASTIARSAKIANAVIYYENPSHPDPRITYPYQVLSCSDTSYGPLPQPGIPCLNRRTEYTKKTAPTPDWIGDWEFEFWALDNGVYRN